MFNLGSTNSAIGYVSYLEDSYLLFTVSKFDYSVKKQAISPKKGLFDRFGLVRGQLYFVYPEQR